MTNRDMRQRRAPSRRRHRGSLGFNYTKAMLVLDPATARRIGLTARPSLCAQCGDAFPSRVDARFCSNKCRQAAYRERVTALPGGEARCCDGAPPTQTHPGSNGAAERGTTAAKAVTAIRQREGGGDD